VYDQPVAIRLSALSDEQYDELEERCRAARGFTGMGASKWDYEVSSHEKQRLMEAQYLIDFHNHEPYLNGAPNLIEE